MSKRCLSSLFTGCNVLGLAEKKIVKVEIEIRF